MSRRSIVATVLVALTASSCATAPVSFPVRGTPVGAATLTGTWDGEYASAESGRQGSIRFVLSADSDSAFGDVLMMPARRSPHSGRYESPAWSAPPRALSIRFVLASDDSVAGVLDPYADPETGETLVTRFIGRMDHRAIVGQFQTLNLWTEAITEGTWAVRRRP